MGTTELPYHTDLVTKVEQDIELIFVVDVLRWEYFDSHFPRIYKEICEDFGLPPIADAGYGFDEYWEYTADFTDLNAMIYLTEVDPVNFPPDMSSWSEELLTEAQEAVSDDFIHDQYLFAIDFHTTCLAFNLSFRKMIRTTREGTPIYRLVNGAVAGVW
jgi:hypothetical protein